MNRISTSSSTTNNEAMLLKMRIKNMAHDWFIFSAALLQENNDAKEQKEN